MPSNCTYMFSVRKVKASNSSLQVQNVYKSYMYFLLPKNPALSEVQRYVIDSLLKHQLTRDNFFALIRSISNKDKYILCTISAKHTSIARLLRKPNIGHKNILYLSSLQHNRTTQRSCDHSVWQHSQTKSRKYQGVFELKSRVQTWPVRGIWSQQLEHKQVPEWGTEPGVRKGKCSLLASHTPLQMFTGNHS